jgi:hypothetical protein
MWFDGPLASLSVVITYFLQVVLVYLTLVRRASLQYAERR